MKNLDLNAYGVKEMNAIEMETVDGGNVVKAVGNAIVTAAKAVATAAVWVYDNVLTQPLSGSLT